MNNPTLGEFCFAMIGRADIEGSKSDVAMNAWPPQASYPCGCFDIDIVLGSPTVQAIVRRTSLLPAQRTRTSRQTKGLPPSRSLSSSRRFRGVTRPDLHSDSKLKKNSRAAAPIGRIKAHWLRRQMKGRSLYPKAPGHAHYTQNLFTLRFCTCGPGTCN